MCEAGIFRKKSYIKKLHHLCCVKRNGYKWAAEQLKKWIKTKVAILKLYSNKVNQFQENNQGKLYLEIYGKVCKENVIQNKEGTQEFWTGTWEKNVKHHENADWIKEAKEEMQHKRQKKLMITQRKSRKEFLEW